MAVRTFAGLAICAGIGGLELGVRLAMGERYRTVGYVEREAYAATVFVARMDDATLDRAVVWDDLTTFHGAAWRGKVDIVTAGFPCQPASYAGRRAGRADDRWLWPAIARIVADVHPRYIFLENVRGLLSVNDGRAFGEVVRALAHLGYDTEWDVFSAGAIGAPHRRERLFIFAYMANATRRRQRIERPSVKREHKRRDDANGGSPAVGNAPRAQRRTRPTPGTEPDGQAAGWAQGSGRARMAGTPVGDANGIDVAPGESEELTDTLTAAFPPGPTDDNGWRRALALDPTVEPAILRMVDGTAARMDRLRAIGNGVVPVVAAVALLTLAGRADVLINEVMT